MSKTEDAAPIDQVIEENKKEVYLNHNDTQAVEKYFSFFKLPMSPELKQVLTNFANKQSWEEQKVLELQILDSFLNSRGNNKQLDEILAPLYDLVRDAYYKLSFNEEFEKAMNSTTTEVK